MIQQPFCPPHRWFIPRETNGIALAKCLRRGCTARQYQPTGVSKELLVQANKLNKEYHFPLITTSRKGISQLEHFGQAPYPHDPNKEKLASYL